MVSFTNKQISVYQTLGEILKINRQKLDLSLAQVEKKTKVAQKYLIALEKGTYHLLPGEIYAKNFLRSYAKVLGLNLAPLLNLFYKEQGIYEKVEPASSQNKKPARALHLTHFLIPSKVIKHLVVGMFLIICLSYLGWELKSIVEPPQLMVKNPRNNLMVSDKSIVVEGQTEKEVTVVINGQEVLGDEAGHFVKDVELSEGLNMIRVSAKKKHSREQVVERQVLVVKN